MTLLAIDVGNSRIKFGLFDRTAAAETPHPLPECVRTLAVRHAEPVPWGTLDAWAGERLARNARLAGVNPAAIARLLAEWPTGRWPRPRVVAKASEVPLAVRVDNPDGVGIDRLLSAVAVNAVRPAGRPAIVVGSGTATTVDLVAADGAFEGGAILPGLELGSRALHQHTALLPLVPLEDLAAADLPAVGRNTSAAIRSGLLYGHVGAVKELIARLSVGLPSDPLVVINGGNGPLLARHLGTHVRVEPDLPLRGLALIAD